MVSFLPFLIFVVVCLFIVVLLVVAFKIGAHFGRSDVDEFRAARCGQCQTRQKPVKTGTVRNLVEFEMRCPRCGHISWDIPPKTNLSSRPTERDEPPL